MEESWGSTFSALITRAAVYQKLTYRKFPASAILWARVKVPPRSPPEGLVVLSVDYVLRSSFGWCRTHRLA